MNKTIIIYRSKTGFTQKYAEMAAKELGCNAQPWGKAQMAGYDTVVFGTRAHAGRIDGLKKALAAFRRSGTKRFVLFVTGAMPHTAGQALEQLWKGNLTEEQLRNIPHFYMQAGLCYERMGVLDRAMMKGLARFLAHKADKTPEDLELEKTIAGSYDISSREYVLPMVEFLRGQETANRQN